MNSKPNRIGSGRSGAGRFTFKTNSESEIELGSSGETGLESADRPGDLTADQIRVLASSPDHDLRAELPGYPNVTDDVLEELQGPDQTVETRQSVLATMYPGVASRAAKDAHPLIRAHALQAGWDLTDEEMSRLRSDRGVMHVIKVVGG